MGGKKEAQRMKNERIKLALLVENGVTYLETTVKF